MGSIDWKELELASPFVKLEKGTSVLVVKNWRLQDKFKNDDGTVKFGLEFDCIQLNNTVFEGEPKSWTMTAIKAINQLKPILQAADEANKPEVRLQIVKAGDGPKTVYVIEEL